MIFSWAGPWGAEHERLSSLHSWLSTHGRAPVEFSVSETRGPGEFPLGVRAGLLIKSSVTQSIFKKRQLIAILCTQVSHALIARMIKFKLNFSFWKKTKCSTLLQMRIGVLCLRLRLQRSRSQRPPPCTEWGVELQRVWSGNSQDKTPLGTTHCELRHRSLSTD